MEYRICRLCESSADTRRMIKYSVRSYAHWECLLKRKSLEDGLEWLRGLHSHQLRNAPVLVVQDWLEGRGWTGERSMELLLRIIKDVEGQEAKR